MDVSANVLLNNGDGGEIKIKDNEIDDFIIVGSVEIDPFKIDENGNPLVTASPNILPDGKLKVEDNSVSNLSAGITGSGNIVGEYIENGNTPTPNIIFP